MSSVKFHVTLDELEIARSENYLKGIMQGEDNIEKLWSAENQVWQQVTTKLRQLAEKHGASREEIDACWLTPVIEPNKNGEQ